MLTTFAALVMPILILLMMAVVNVGHVVDAKIRLQNAADRAAYAGAAKQAYIMNEMGKQNGEIHRIFEKFKSDVGPNSSNDKGDVDAKLKSSRNQIAVIANTMQDWNRDAYGWTEKVSRDVAQANVPSVTVRVRIPNQDMVLLKSDYESGQSVAITADYNVMETPVIWEPKDHNNVTNNLFSYIVKDPATEARWQVALTQKLPDSPVTRFFNIPELSAVAAAQPHGGSIKACAFDPNCSQYQVSFVPFQDDQGGHYDH